MTLNDADLPSQVLLPELLYRMQRRRSHWREIDDTAWHDGATHRWCLGPK